MFSQPDHRPLTLDCGAWMYVSSNHPYSQGSSYRLFYGPMPRFNDKESVTMS
jgi:hypothetical protein